MIRPPSVQSSAAESSAAPVVPVQLEPMRLCWNVWRLIVLRVKCSTPLCILNDHKISKSLRKDFN
jgi:hypothetical protein